MEEKNKEKELILCSLLDAALHAEPHVENQAALKAEMGTIKTTGNGMGKYSFHSGSSSCAAAFV